MLLLLACTDDVSVTKRYTPPEIAFVEPEDGASFLQGEAVTFRAWVSDDQDDPDEISVKWTSDLDGLLGEGFPEANGSTVVADATLSVGIHAITLTALDTEGGEAAESLAIEVVGVGDAPDVAFVRPLSTESGRVDEATGIRLQVEDAQDEAGALALRVESDLDGELCAPVADALGVAECEVFLSDGDHVLSATVTDTEGYDGVAELAFTVHAADEIDDDGDGWTELQGDCDDHNDSISPGGAESPDGADEDCDGQTDEGTDAYDDDGDGWSENDGDCDDDAASVSPDATEVCDAVDQDCDGLADDGTECADDDGDGWTELAGDCDDAEDEIAPGAVERSDGVDEDCDGAVDEGTSVYDDDGDCACEGGSCTGSVNVGCAELVAGDCDDADPNTVPGGPEWCDALDNDCDGEVDEDDAVDAEHAYLDADGDGSGDPAGLVQACALDPSWVLSGDDCDDADADVHPGATESCDGEDEDCDGDVDEDAADAGSWYLDADGDGHGDPAVQVSACEAPEGYVALGDDCDDDNGSRNCPDW